MPHYDYQKSAPFWDTRHPSGYYTEFGTVTELAQELDDAVVIVGPGEAVKLQFAEAVEPLKQDWQRFFVLEANGCVKYMDMFTQGGDTVDSLPMNGE